MKPSNGSYISLGLLAVLALTLVYQVLNGNVPRVVFAVLIVLHALIRAYFSRSKSKGGWFNLGVSLLLAVAIVLAK